MSERSPLGRVIAWAVAYEGSTRSAAILRICLPYLIWGRWARNHIFYETVGDPLHFVFSVGFFVGGAMMLIGLYTRFSVAVVALVMSVWHLYYGHELGISKAITSVNLWTPVVALMFTDCGKSLSVDRWLAVRRARREGRPLPSERGNVWGLRLIAWQLSMMYFWAAFDKTDMHWLSGARMERYWTHWYGTSDPPTQWWFRPMILCASIGTTILEYILCFALWFRVGRRWLLIPGLLFHFLIYITLPAFTIGFQVMVCYLAFVPVDQFRRWSDDLLGVDTESPQPREPEPVSEEAPAG